MAVIQMTDDRFEEVVLKSELPVMVDFGATWCGPCKKVEPIIEELAEDYAGKVIAVKCDVEECPGRRQERRSRSQEGVCGEIREAVLTMTSDYDRFNLKKKRS